MLRQINEVLQDAFPDWYPQPKLAILRPGNSRVIIATPKAHVVGLMTYDRVEKMRIQAMNCMQDNEYKLLSNIIQDYLLPMRWNKMDIEFGVNH